MTNWQSSERLTDDEFGLLLPHLGLENVLLVEVYFPKKKWLRLITADLETFTYSCNVCIKEDKLENVYKHLKMKEHYNLLKSDVVQFYHPFYTYGKSDVKLAKGEQVSPEKKNTALKEVNSKIKCFSKNVSISRNCVRVLRRREQESKEDFLINLALKLKATKPKHMFVKVCIPFDDLTELQFCWNSGDWQPVLTARRLTWKGSFTCNVCSVVCSGIDCVNSHFKGYTHKWKQLTLYGLCYDKCAKVTQNACVTIGEKLSVSIHNDAEVFFRKDLDKWKYMIGDDEQNSDQIKLEELPKEIMEKTKVLEAHVRKVISTSENLIKVKEDENYLGHIGVEYVLKIVRHVDDVAATYECTLCEISGNEERMQHHLLKFEHIRKYLDVHYADTVKKYECSIGHMRYVEFRCVMGEIATRIAIGIEKHHGRSLPLTVHEEDYKANRNEFISEVFDMMHASQNHGPSFSNVVTREEIEKLKSTVDSHSRPKIIVKKIVFNTTPSDKVYLRQMSHDPATRKKVYKTKQSWQKSRSSSYNSQEENHYSHDRKSSRSKSRSLRRGELSKSPIDNIWEDYRRLLASEADVIERIYEGYRKNPESHPDYEKEWNIFWQRRKQELEKEGKYRYSYDFQPEWVQYFKQRIEQLFGDELHNSQVNIRRKLQIPLDAEEMDSSKCTDKDRFYNDHYNQYNKIDGAFGRVSAEDDMAFHELPKRSHFGDGDNVGSKRRCLERTPYEDDYQGSPHNLRKSVSPVNLGNISDNHSNVVYVLRLLTALEDYLGSLGDKVMDIFAKALQLEKCFRGNIIEFEAKVLTASNCNMLETAMEKLKGILFAGLLDEKKIEAFKRVIQVTTELLMYAEKRGWRKDIIMIEDDSNVRVLNEEKTTKSKLLHREKSLTDTLMDFMYSQKYDKHSNDNTDAIACPPPPLIKMSDPSLSYISNKDGRGINFKATSDSVHRSQQKQHCSTSLGYSYEGTKSMGLSNSNGNNLGNNSYDNTVYNSSRSNTGPPSGFKNHPSRLSTSNNELNTQKAINSMNRDMYISRTNQEAWGSWNKRN